MACPLPSARTAAALAWSPVVPVMAWSGPSWWSPRSSPLPLVALAIAAPPSPRAAIAAVPIAILRALLVMSATVTRRHEVRMSRGVLARGRSHARIMRTEHHGAVRVLIAEDDRRLAALLRRGLTESGFQVDVVVRGDDALDALAR